MAERATTKRTTPRDPLIGRTIHGRYTVLSLLARGGMGRVYRARQVPLGRDVALKVLEAAGPDAASLQARFMVEAQSVAKLRHANTVTVFDFGRTEDGLCFIAMELIDGVSLREAIRKFAPFSPERTATIALQIARALREAHQLGVIHRDLKPANVMLTRNSFGDEFVKVVDFGLVKNIGEIDGLTRVGEFMGTPMYMAPEHIMGHPLDGRVDIYALGVCMVEMLTGDVPFAGTNLVEILSSQLSARPVLPPEVTAHPALAELVLRCLAKRAEDRPRSMDELIAALERAVPEAAPARPLPGTRVDFDWPPVSSAHAHRGTLSRPAAHDTHEQAPCSALHTVEAPPMLSGRWGPVLAQAVLTAVLLGVGAMLGVFRTIGLQGVSPLTHVEAQPTGTGAGTAAPPPARLAAAPRPLRAARTIVDLGSTPSGATVWIDGRAYGPTPASIELPDAPLGPARELRLVFTKPGFEPLSVARVVTGARTVIQAELARARKAPLAEPLRDAEGAHDESPY